MDISTLLPENYISLVGTVCLLVGILCLLCTFSEGNKKHWTKVFSILLVASLSLFSNHVTTYFAAIFIVATAVTELEFLQTLAAIIRKDENYFNYRKEAITTEENIKRKAEEVIEEEYVDLNGIDEIPPETGPQIDLTELDNMASSTKMRLYFDIEERALTYLESEFGNIERNVRFIKDGSNVECDGFIPGNKQKLNTIFEVKWIKDSSKGLRFIFHLLQSAKNLRSRFESITGISADFHLVVVTNTESGLPQERLTKLQMRAKDMNIQLRFMTLNDIGYEIKND